MEYYSIKYKVLHRAVKYPRLEFRTEELLLILPPGVKPEEILEKHKNWIMEKYKFIKKCLEESKGKTLNRRSEEEFEKIVSFYVGKFSQELGIELNRIYFRKMKTKWGSLSNKKNLIINKLMKYLPDELIAYVIFHELAHIFEKRHNKRFWEIISHKYKTYKAIEKELFVYWFLIERYLNENND